MDLKRYRQTNNAQRKYLVKRSFLKSQLLKILCYIQRKERINMLNLIRKDIVLQKNTLMIMLPLLFVSLFLSTSAIWFGFIFCFAIIMQSFSMDEKTSIHLL